PRDSTRNCRPLSFEFTLVSRPHQWCGPRYRPRGYYAQSPGKRKRESGIFFGILPDFLPGVKSSPQGRHQRPVGGAFASLAAGADRPSTGCKWTAGLRKSHSSGTAAGFGAGTSRGLGSSKSGPPGRWTAGIMIGTRAATTASSDASIARVYGCIGEPKWNTSRRWMLSASAKVVPFQMQPRARMLTTL